MQIHREGLTITGRQLVKPEYLQELIRHEQGRGSGTSIWTCRGYSHQVVEEPFSGWHNALRKSLEHFHRWGRNVVFVTCVDRNATRQEVAKVCKNYPAWWIDTGNLKTSGQVSVGRELFGKELSPLRLPSVTTWTPSPALQFPKIMRS